MTTTGNQKPDNNQEGSGSISQTFRDKLKRLHIHIDYNAPVVLTYALICIVVFILDLVSNSWFSLNVFSLSPTFSFTDFLSYPRIILHIFGHAGAQHLTLNLAVILLVGPILEEKYGSLPLLYMCLITALLTGLLNVLLFDHGLLGASGIAFMLIILSSFANAKSGTIPLTFILIAILYLSNEIYRSFSDDHISQFAHILGGVCGGVFGFYMMKKKKEGAEPISTPDKKVFYNTDPGNKN